MAQDIGPDLLEPKHGFAIGDIHLMDHGLRVDVRLLTGGKIVEDMNLVTALDESIDDMRSDKPGPARNYDFHAFGSSDFLRK
jgi:hypothetical protein